MTDEDHWGMLASALSSFDRSEDDDDDEISLDVTEGNLLANRASVSRQAPESAPVHQGKRYLQMKKLVDALLAGNINKLAFINRIRPIAHVQQQFVSVMDEPQTRARFAQVSQEEQELFKGVRRCLAAVGTQLQRMATSGESEDVEEVRAAMQEITSIYGELQTLQERIVEIGYVQ